MWVDLKIRSHKVSIIGLVIRESSTMRPFTFWISLSLSPKFGLRPKISQKSEVVFRLDSANRSAIR